MYNNASTVILEPTFRAATNDTNGSAGDVDDWTRMPSVELKACGLARPYMPPPRARMPIAVERGGGYAGVGIWRLSFFEMDLDLGLCIGLKWIDVENVLGGQFCSGVAF